MNTTVLLRATPITPFDSLDPEDRSVAGIYRIELGEGVPVDAKANAAKDVFHSNIPVTVLDDFEFSVHTEDMKTELEDGDYEDYQFSDSYVSMRRIGDLTPAAVEAPKRVRGRKP